MSGYEEQLHARAEMLEETSELAAAVTAILAGASSAGLDPHAIVSLRAAITELDPAGAPPGYQAGSRTGRHPGSGYGSDAEFLEAVSDAEDQTLDGLRDTGQLQEQVIAALDVAQTTGTAQRDLQPPGRTWPPRTPCPPRTVMAATAARPPRSPPPRQPSPGGGTVRDAERRISICEDTAEILDSLTRRLQAALQALRQVPHDLGEVYELIYAFIRRGGKMPHPGRWITGETPVPA